MRHPRWFVLFFICAAVRTSPLAAQWGSLEGKIVVEGNIPQLSPLIRPRAGVAAVCAAAGVPDESIVVDPATKGLANVVIYLRKKTERVHPELVATPISTVLYDQIGCKFVPHVAVVRTDQQLNIVSADPVAHNPRGNPFRNQGFNFIISPVDRVGMNVPFSTGENQPFDIGCDIHPWMRGYILVSDHPYATVSAANGTFAIKDLPTGEHEFRFWHERLGYLKSSAGERSLKINIADGKTTTLPTISIPSQHLLDGKQP
jgi:hypothetical protein